tara:strand:+ start:63 stop:1061 length:999 start_codon:yes stop_codon:yes gene_type:complete
MTETSDALNTQTKEILGEKVVLGPGFENSYQPEYLDNSEAMDLIKKENQESKYGMNKVNYNDIEVEDLPTDGIINKIKRYLGIGEEKEKQIIEARPGQQFDKDNLPTEDAEIKTELPKKEEPVIDYDANWYQSDDTVNILKDESYSNLYAKGEVGKEMGYQLPLGYRTNNWLSIHQLGIDWDGLSEIKEDKKVLPNFKKETHSVMEVFDTPEFGVRAAMVDVMTKALKTGSPEMTLKKLIDSGYMENATNYVNVGKGLGINLNTKFNLFNKEEAMKWFDYMLLSEMGTFKNNIPKAERDKVFNSAYSMAMDRMRDESYTYHSTAKKYLDSSQ